MYGYNKSNNKNFFAITLVITFDLCYNNIMVFKDKLKMLREEEKLSQNELAKRLKVSQATVSQWEAGTREPTAGALIAVARYFDTSTDFVLGIVDSQLKLVPYYKDLNREEQVMMQSYTRLTPSQKTAINELIRVMTEK